MAIADGRILSIDDERVAFRYCDYRDGKLKTMRLDGEEFVRRFALHVLPKRFTRIRYYGFLANRNRSVNLQRCRDLIEEGGHGTADQEQIAAGQNLASPDLPPTDPVAAMKCPRCSASMIRGREIERAWPHRGPQARAPAVSA